jgi:hypothetical protein
MAIDLTVFVVFLQREAGVRDMLRVAPLFETLEDLDHSETAMETLLGNEWYAAHIKGAQECMIGYSDSGKDAGRLAAAWGLYEVQVREEFALGRDNPRKEVKSILYFFCLFLNKLTSLRGMSGHRHGPA